MFCSTIIPTINRPTLSRAVISVLDQNFSARDFEVIVVNDSGQPLPETDWQASERVRVINTNRRERSVARNTGAAIARGKYLHFLDDDDLLLPDALEAFWKLEQEKENDAIWLYGSYQTVDNYGNIIEIFHPEIEGDLFAILVSGESIPFQASLLKTECFYACGAFDPDPIIRGVEDRDLGRRYAFAGQVAYTPTTVAEIRIGEQGSTTNWKTIAEGDRWGREKALSMPNTFTRLRGSATSNYWHGRVCRAYIASMVWNLQRRNLFTAANRATASLAFTGLHALSLEFWNGLRTKIK